MLGERLSPNTLTHFKSSLLLDVVSLLPKARFASMLTGLQIDDLVELFEHFPLGKLHQTIDLLLPRTRLLIKKELSYAENSAGLLMRR